MTTDSLRLRQVTTATDVEPALRRALVNCWVDVTNAGGAAGFPFPSIDAQHAAPALDALVDGLGARTSRLLVAMDGGRVAGWLTIRRDTFPLIAHWGTVHHVQTRPEVRGRGIGGALMKETRRIARDEMSLEQLRLAVRGGAGLETFYGRLGWQEIGRWPAALRLTPTDDRDEVLMLLSPL
ncbi:GNAT family N-acetyltransferase [Streptomyces sp. 71268]|uniref:GNAT family N-acetyltransferase n=1 Tax=Streptomyces sp. 71268 TaxID=3002640 RepID=UPI0023F8B236|nr:GNAT family N-acetyltransferase [Streptomyces sp. 71268]WEV26239.1 GNAT family N-acetyltransferase [Streptomyces sp. 71268]